MINKVIITNHLNESITMDLRFPEQSGFLIFNINGLGPAKAEINMTDLSGSDGAIYNSAAVNPRNIVFRLGFLETASSSEETAISIETVRQNSYKYFPIKRQIGIEIQTDRRSSKIFGYVEANEPDIFSSQEETVISVLCPDPALYDVNDQLTLFSSVTPLFEFPFSNESTTLKLIEFSSMFLYTEKAIYYLGDLEVGIIIHIHAIGNATVVKITEAATLKTIEIDDTKLIGLVGSGIQSGDDIFISTVPGNKYVRLYRNGVVTNILNALKSNPTWFKISKGDNVFAYNASTGLQNLQFEIINKIAYEGI